MYVCVCICVCMCIQSVYICVPSQTIIVSPVIEMGITYILQHLLFRKAKEDKINFLLKTLLVGVEGCRRI